MVNNKKGRKAWGDPLSEKQNKTLITLNQDRILGTLKKCLFSYVAPEDIVNSIENTYDFKRIDGETIYYPKSNEDIIIGASIGKVDGKKYARFFPILRGIKNRVMILNIMGDKEEQTAFLYVLPDGTKRKLALHDSLFAKKFPTYQIGDTFDMDIAGIILKLDSINREQTKSFLHRKSHVGNEYKFSCEVMNCQIITCYSEEVPVYKIDTVCFNRDKTREFGYSLYIPKEILHGKEIHVGDQITGELTLHGKID